MSVHEDQEELNDILESQGSSAPARTRAPFGGPLEKSGSNSSDDDYEPYKSGALRQWLTTDGTNYIPSSDITLMDKLPPGVYIPDVDDRRGPHFSKVPVKTEGLLRFPDSNSDTVVAEIQKFWETEDTFREYGLSYKRGIILWGPAGSGKSSTLQLIMKDVIERGGVVLNFDYPGGFIECYRLFKKIQPETPSVVVMEDIDSIIQRYSESSVLNILDGVEAIDKTVFLATTNYPDRLGARIINRPSRFDKRFKIGMPSAEAREMYLRHLIKEDRVDDLEIPLEQWVADTKDFTLSHLRELFIAVLILGDNYEDAVKTLASMKEQIIPESEFQERKSSLGFGRWDEDEDDEVSW
jgi:hypothetical protein